MSYLNKMHRWPGSILPAPDGRISTADRWALLGLDPTTVINLDVRRSLLSRWPSLVPPIPDDHIDIGDRWHMLHLDRRKAVDGDQQVQGNISIGSVSAGEFTVLAGPSADMAAALPAIDASMTVSVDPPDCCGGQFLIDSASAGEFIVWQNVAGTIDITSASAGELWSTGPCCGGEFLITSASAGEFTIIPLLVASGDASLPLIQVDIQVDVDVAAQIEHGLPAMQAEAVGSAPFESLVMDAYLPSLEASSDAYIPTDIAITVGLPAMYAASSGDATRNVSIDAALPAMGSASSLSAIAGASSAVVLPSLEAASFAQTGDIVIVSVSPVLPSLSSTATAELPIDANSGVNLPSLRSESEATSPALDIDADITALFPSLQAKSGIFSLEINAVISVNLPSMRQYSEIAGPAETNHPRVYVVPQGRRRYIVPGFDLE